MSQLQRFLSHERQSYELKWPDDKEPSICQYYERGIEGDLEFRLDAESAIDACEDVFTFSLGCGVIKIELKPGATYEEKVWLQIHAAMTSIGIKDIQRTDFEFEEYVHCEPVCCNHRSREVHNEWFPTLQEMEQYLQE